MLYPIIQPPSIVKNVTPQETLPNQNYHNAYLLGTPITITNVSSIPLSKDIKDKQPSSLAQKEIPIDGVIELNADQQSYDNEKRVINAKGNVVLKFKQAVLNCDRLQINLDTKIAVAEGNVVLRRGKQILQGEVFEYYFSEDKGTIFNAVGEIQQSSLNQDTNIALPNEINPSNIFTPSLVDNITNTGNYTFVFGGTQPAQNLPSLPSGGRVNNLRFQADKIEFNGSEWLANKIRLTNDPVSPPEIEVRANTAKLRQLPSGENELTTTNSRVVFDQSLSLPIFQNRIVSNKRKQPGFISIGFDNGDKGGVFIFNSFSIIDNPNLRLSITPQFYIQRAFSDGIDTDTFGLTTKLESTINSRTTLAGSANIITFNPDKIGDTTRANIRLTQTLGNKYPHNLSLEYNYRDRLFNGSLGFQTVQSSFGGVLTSPSIPLGKTGINLSYQASIQYINADTDKQELLSANRTNNRVNLSRYQGSASFSKGFLLWQGKPLDADPNTGLKYTPIPITPSISLGASITGVYSGYSSGERQGSVNGSIVLDGKFGHLSKPFLDYTGINIGYSEVIRGGDSPFLFDRGVDNKVLSLGITQQIYGGLLFGFQTRINLDNNQQFYSDYVLEYSRRSYNISLRYNPDLAIGVLSFRLNDFNWGGTPAPFDDIHQVIDGVKR